MKASRILVCFEKHAQDGLGIRRPPEELRSVAPLGAARIRALCAFGKHAQNGLGIKRPPEELRTVSPLRAARIRALCALPIALSTLFASSAENLRIKVIEGQDSVNHIKTMSAVQPSIQVFDAQGAPVNGAEVTFLLPSAGPGASFKGWLRSEVVETNQDGRATAVGLQPNREAGQFLIKVSAVSGSTRGSAMITQTNVLKEPKPPKQKREPLPCVRSVFGVCLERADQCDGTGAKR